MGTPAKTKNKEKLLAYLSNPDNDWPTRTEMSITVLGYKNQEQIYAHFTPEELQEIESQSLGIRRQKYSRHFAEIDRGLLDKAKSGDSAACKLAYQRFEGWAERNEQSGPNGSPMEQKWTVEFINATPKSKQSTRAAADEVEED